MIRCYYCKRCKTNRLFDINQVDHLLHFFISVLLHGMWVPVWGVITLLCDGNPTCLFCGHSPATLGDSIGKFAKIVVVTTGVFVLFFGVFLFCAEGYNPDRLKTMSAGK